MATDLQIREQLDTMRSLPPRLEKLESFLGTVQWPGQGERLNFPSGMELSAEEIRWIEDRLAGLEAIMTGTNLDAGACSRARLSLLTKLLLGYPSAGATTEKAAEARLGFYLESVGDVAPWALDAAIKRWVKGEVPNANVDFAPSPGTLRRLCEVELAPYQAVTNKLMRLRSAVSVDRAMDPAPIEPKALPGVVPLPRLKAI